MSDALADVALLRAAGYYQTQDVDPDEDMPHPHAAQPDAPQPVLLTHYERGVLLDALDTCPDEIDHTTYQGIRSRLARPGAMPPVAETVDALVKELATARGLLKAFAATPHLEALFVDDYVWQCVHCHIHADSELLAAPTAHAPDCPWRLAQEYVDGLEAGK